MAIIKKNREFVLATFTCLAISQTNATQTEHLTSDDNILQNFVKYSIQTRCDTTQEIVDKAYSDAVTALRACNNYARNMETVDSLKERFEVFLNKQKIDKSVLYKMPVYELECDATDITFSNYFRLPYDFSLIEYLHGVKQGVIMPSPEQSRKIFDSPSNCVSTLPIGFIPSNGQKFAPDICFGKNGLRMHYIVESVPIYFAHEFGHYYFDTIDPDINVKYSNAECRLLNASKPEDNNTNLREYVGLNLCEEVPTWILEFKYILEHEEELKTGDAGVVIDRACNLLNPEFDRATYRLMNLALSLASLEKSLKDTLRDTMTQLRYLWKDKNVADELERLEFDENAISKDFGISFDTKRKVYVAKYNANNNLNIIKRWLGKIGYSNAQDTVQKIKDFIKEACAATGKNV